MTLHQAEKVVVITERMVLKQVCQIIESCGATGYTTVAAGGKGSRNMRSTSECASVVDDFANIKVEIIVNDQAMAEAIMDRVTEEVFQHYCGITYLENVQILRPTKF